MQICRSLQPNYDVRFIDKLLVYSPSSGGRSSVVGIHANRFFPPSLSSTHKTPADVRAGSVVRSTPSVGGDVLHSSNLSWAHGSPLIFIVEWRSPPQVSVMQTILLDPSVRLKWCCIRSLSHYKLDDACGPPSFGSVLYSISLWRSMFAHACPTFVLVSREKYGDDFEAVRERTSAVPFQVSHPLYLTFLAISVCAAKESRHCCASTRTADCR